MGTAGGSMARRHEDVLSFPGSSQHMVQVISSGLQNGKQPMQRNYYRSLHCSSLQVSSVKSCVWQLNSWLRGGQCENAAKLMNGYTDTCTVSLLTAHCLEIAGAHSLTVMQRNQYSGLMAQTDQIWSMFSPTLAI